MGASEANLEGQSLAPLEDALGHKFRDPEILAWSLIHRSYHAEHPGVAHNERFEFLGDAVLGLAVTTFLFNEFGHMPEGQMAKVRAAVVSREELAEVAQEIGLPAYVRLGRGEDITGGRHKPSILADAMEALIAAVYLDAGYDHAASVVMTALGGPSPDRGHCARRCRLQDPPAGSPGGPGPHASLRGGWLWPRPRQAVHRGGHGRRDDSRGGPRGVQARSRTRGGPGRPQRVAGWLNVPVSSDLRVRPG